ncbi:MAG: CCA tRNA nucleotidyltransferase [Micrococcaceae bacterium]
MPKDFLPKLPPIVHELAELFTANNFELALVGGPVRDLLLGRKAPDLDFTTNAYPDDIIAVVKNWADNLWEIGKEFGTIALEKAGEQIEITTYRAEKYDSASRKPVVSFGTKLEEDLVRRDFTVNALAIKLPTGELIDVTNGKADLAAKILRTPDNPEASFDDDPLRIMRAARFVSQLPGFIVDDTTLTAMSQMRERLKIVSNERIRDELVKLICGANPVAGIEVMRKTGLLKVVLPEVAELQLGMKKGYHHKDIYAHTMTVLRQAIDLETAENGSCPTPDFILRFAALMHDIGKPATRKFEKNGVVSFYHHDLVGAKLTRNRMRELRFDKKTTKKVSRLVELHLRFFGYADGAWSDAGVRRYVTDAGDLLEYLHRITRADVTTKNKRKAQKLNDAYDDLEYRITELKEKEELDAVRPDLNGHEIMKILDIRPGPVLGKAYNYLLKVRLDKGPLSKVEATDYLKKWWSENNE